MNPLENLHKQIDTHNLWEKEFIVERNEFLKQAGTTDTNLYYVLEGSLRIYVLDENEEHTIRFGYHNNFISSLDSFILEKPSDLIIQALKKTLVKSVPKKLLYKMIQSNPEILQNWNLIQELMIVQQFERERDILTASPQERYNRVLKRSPQLFQEVPHKYIASYLRMTPETLSRIKKS